MQFELTPIEGLLVMWNLPFATKAADSAYKMFQKQDIAAKYTIEDIGTIKAGWGGQDSSYDGDAKKLGDINVAFDLTAVENLYVTVGVKFPIVNSDYKDANPNYKLVKVALGASYQILDNLKVSANFGMQTYKKSDTEILGFTFTTKKKPDFQFGVGVDVGLTDTLALVADFRGLLPGGYDVDGTKIDGVDPMFSFLVGLQYNMSSNGYIGIGFQGSTNGCGLLAGAESGIDAYDSDSFCWAVPIAVSVSF